MRTIFILLMTATTAGAEGWAHRAGDADLASAAVAAEIVGRTLVYYDDGRSKFSAGGAYSYTYASGDSAFGRFAIQEDGTVCITFRNGSERCDKYAENGGRLVMLTQGGARFPIREME